ncbi:hypothetical protein AKJ18_10805 [Vibrio xuii]|nr:hypothetical protein AKJ18_10805 [Vibrio xuii]
MLISIALTGCHLKSDSPELGKESSKEEVTLKSLDFKNDKYTIFIGDDMSLSGQLVAVYSDGVHKNLTYQELDDVSWSFSGVGTYIDYDEKASTLTAIGENDSALVITATYGDQLANAQLNVIDDMAQIQLTTNSDSIYVGNSVRASVTGVTLSNKIVDLTMDPDLTWSFSNNAAVNKETMEITATQAGIVSFGVGYERKTGETLQGSSNIDVKALNVSSGSSLVITPPAQTTVVAGSSVQLTSQLIDDNGQVIESGLINWSSNKPTLATVTPQGTVNFIEGQSGIVEIKASFSDRAKNTQTTLEHSIAFTVESKQLSKVVTTSSKDKVFTGQSVVLESLATYTDGTSADLSNSITYSVSPPAQINGNQISFGNLTSLYTITPTIGDTSYEPVEVRVIAPSIETVSIDVNLDILMVGQKRELLAWGTMTDGSTLELSDVVSWTVSQPDILVINNNQITGIGAGKVKLTAVYNGMNSAPVSLQVMDYPVTHINIRQFYPKIDEYFIVNMLSLDDVSAASFEFDVTATYKSVGLKGADLRDVTFSWLSEAGSDLSLSIHRLDNQRFSFRVLEGSGKGMLTVSYKGVSQSIIVEVMASRSITSFDIAPKSTLHVKDSSVVYSAIASFSDDTSLVINPNQIIWSSNNPQVATVSPSGVVSYHKEGTAMITGRYTTQNDMHTSTFDVTVIPFYVERLEFIDPEYWPEEVYVDEYLDIYESLYAVLSNGSKINLGFHDVTVSSKLGLADVYNTWAITVGGAGEEVITVTYEGVSLNLPPVNVVESVSPVEVRCSIGYMVVDLWGAPCWLQQGDRRIKASSLEFDHPDFAPNVSHIANSYTFDYVGDSNGDVPTGTTLTACLRDSENCSTRHFDLVPVNKVSDERDGETIFVKSGVPTTIPVVYGISASNYTNVNTIEYFQDFNMTLRDDKTLGRFIDNLFYAENEGESVVDVYLKWGKKDDQFIKSTRNLIVAEPTYEVSSDTIEITGSFPADGIPLPSLVTMTLENQDGSQSNVSDITSELVIDVTTPDFEIVNDKLFYRGSSLPTLVSFSITSASVNYLDILESDEVSKVITVPIVILAP